jgi:Spy/CpxP family protein refolding chaperone
MRRTLVLTSLMLVLMAATVIAQPAPGRGPAAPPVGALAGPPTAGPGGPGGGDQVALLTDLLELTESQQTAWKQIRTDADTAVSSLAEQGRTLRDEVRQALEAGTADPATVGTKVIAIQALDVKVKTAMDAAHEAFKALLTTEQTAKLAVWDKIHELMRKSAPAAGGPR